MTGWGGMLRGGRSKGKAFANESAVPERKPPVPTQKSLKDTKNKVRRMRDFLSALRIGMQREVAQRYFPLEPNPPYINVAKISA